MAKKRVQRKLGLCPSCGKYCWRTSHHVFPQRFYGHTGDSELILLCRSCHDDLEEMIPRWEQMPDQWYIEVIHRFLGRRTWRYTTNRLMSVKDANSYLLPNPMLSFSPEAITGTA